MRVAKQSNPFSSAWMRFTAIFFDSSASGHPQFETYTANKESARNLVHNLALRRHDPRGLQEQLAVLGLSSLGRTESQVSRGSTRFHVLHYLRGRAVAARTCATHRHLDLGEGKALLCGHSEALWGGVRETERSDHGDDGVRRRTKTMVGHLFVANGMDWMRINCVHDGVEAWAGMIEICRRRSGSLAESVGS